MATTDAKTGFRLPWSGDRTETTDPVTEPQTEDAPVQDVASPDQEIETPPMIDALPDAPDHLAAVDAGAAVQPSPVTAPPPAPAPAPARKPNKFMADLTKAMQAAAETAREDTLQRFSADAKTHIEAIHATSASEATELRKKADDDVAAVREWSKQEIARIREETDERIAHRKTRLETEIESHAGEIEARIERVQARVTSFENEMSAFFERLLAEDDPTRFASMAESLPEPPLFDIDDHDASPVGAAHAEPTPVPTPLEPVAATAPSAEAPAAETEPAIETEPSSSTASTLEAAGFEAPVQAGADEPTAVVDTQTERADWPAADPLGDEPGAEADLFSIGTEEAPDPRLSALGLDRDFAAAEAEAAAIPHDDARADDDIPVIADDALAARLAGLVPDGNDGATERASTRVIVLGLVSVASI